MKLRNTHVVHRHLNKAFALFRYVGVLLFVFGSSFSLIGGIPSEDSPRYFTASHDQKNNSAYRIVFGEFSIDDLSQQFCSFDIKIQTKLKVRYQASYCYCNISPEYTSIQQHEFVATGETFPITDCFLTNRFCFSFQLRGPPALSIAHLS